MLLFLFLLRSVSLEQYDLVFIWFYLLYFLRTVVPVLDELSDFPFNYWWSAFIDCEFICNLPTQILFDSLKLSSIVKSKLRSNFLMLFSWSHVPCFNFLKGRWISIKQFCFSSHIVSDIVIISRCFKNHMGWLTTSV